MIRNDGTYVIYILQVQWKDGDWLNIGDAEQYCDGKGDFREEPRRSFNAIGECWQQTGIHGTFNLVIASHMLTLIAMATPGRKFRLMKAEITQKQTEVLRMGL